MDENTPQTQEQELQGAPSAPSASAQGEQTPQSKPNKAKLYEELSQNLESYEKGFAKQCASLIEGSPELEELFFEDKEAFFQRVLDFQNKYLKENLIDKRDAIIDLEQNEQLEAGIQALQQAKDEFAKAHPDVNADELMQFYLTLPQEQQAQLDKLPPNQLFETLYQMQQQSGAAGEGGGGSEEQLPTQLNGMPSKTSELEPELDLPTTRY